MELVENKENYRVYIEEIEDKMFRYTLIIDKGHPNPMLEKIEAFSNNRLIFEVIGSLRNYTPNVEGAEYSNIFIRCGRESRNISFDHINTIISDEIISDDKYSYINGKYISKNNKSYKGVLVNNKFYLIFWKKTVYFKNIDYRNCKKKSFLSRIKKSN